MKVAYIGLAPRHRERLYGTGVTFHFPGDIQEVPDDVGEKLVTRHPDVFSRLSPNDGEPVIPVRSFPTPPTPPEQEPVPPASGGSPEDPPGDPESDSTVDDEFDPSEITIEAGEGGEPIKIPLDRASKDDLEAFCLKHFKVDLDKRKSRENLVGEVNALIAEHGHPEAPASGEEAGE